MQKKLFMVLLGCTPKGRNTEQHDVFFGIGKSIADLKTQMENFWPGTQLHIDAWREVTNVDGFLVEVITSTEKKINNKQQLYFLNLGGYKQNEFEEFHYKMLAVAADKGKAVKAAMKSAFYKHTSLPGKGTSHIDDRYGVDVDDIYSIKDILSDEIKSQFSILISDKIVDGLTEDELHLGYLKWSEV